MNMAYTRIVCQICSVILGHARLDFVAKWLACETLESEYQGRFPGGHLLQIDFLSCNAKLLHTSNIELYK